MKIAPCNFELYRFKVKTFFETQCTGFLLVGRLDYTTRSRNIKPKVFIKPVVFKVQKMARYASFCLIMGPFKGEVPVFARLWPV